MAAHTTIEKLMADIKTLGLGESKKDSGSRIIVYTTEKDRVGVLRMIAETFDGRYSASKSGPGWKSSQGSAQVGSYTVLVKPAAKAGQVGSLGSMDARVFAKYGKSGTFAYGGTDVQVMSFTSKKMIETSIIKGAAESSMLGKDISEQFADFFDSGKFTWDPQMPPLLLNKLGVYAGELLVGWAFFTSNRKKWFDTDPFTGSPVAFHLPTDPAFSGVDSFVEMKDGSYYSISSKFGVGAKASFFSNLLGKGVAKRSKLNNSVFKQICDLVGQKGLDYKKSKDVVYAWGFEKLLKLKINNTNDVFQAIVQGKKTADLNKVILAIRAHPLATTDVKSKLPRSVSGFFNRSMADMLNKDQKSLDEIVSILAGKDYWQGNLQTKEWGQGILRFKFVKAGKARVRFIGNKAALDDISCKQGWVNYELAQ
jgi:hypothetical protein